MTTSVTRKVDPIRWHSFSSLTQMGNIASEITRFLSATGEQRARSLERALELVDLTLEDVKSRTAQKEEMQKLREVIVSQEKIEGNRESLLDYCNAFGLAWALRQMQS